MLSVNTLNNPSDVNFAKLCYDASLAISQLKLVQTAAESSDPAVVDGKWLADAMVVEYGGAENA